MPIKCIARRMSGGREHEHISDIKWEQDKTDKTGETSTTEMIKFIQKEGDNSVYCPDQNGGSGAWVHVRTNGQTRFLQTVADNKWTNNLLALPLF